MINPKSILDPLKLSNKKLIFALSLGAVAGAASLTLPIPHLKIINTNAEVATQGDWIGLFTVGSTGNSKADTYNSGGSWMWAGNSSDPNTCRVLPLSPHLGGSCSPFNNASHSPTGLWNLPTGGAYEFRLYGNNQQGGSNNMLAQSAAYWGDMAGSFASSCFISASNRYYVNLFWPSNLLTKGIDSYKIYKRTDATAPAPPIALNSVGYPSSPRYSVPPSTDNGLLTEEVASGSAYTYVMVEHSTRADKWGHNDSISQSGTNALFSTSIAINDTNCKPAWLKTSGGDVHSNR